MHRTLKRVSWLIPCILLLSILCTSMPSFSRSAQAASASAQATSRARADIDPPLSEMQMTGTKEALRPERRERWRHKVIIIRLNEQRLYAYENGRLVFKSGVTTGRPSLPTP